MDKERRSWESDPEQQSTTLIISEIVGITFALFVIILFMFFIYQFVSQWQNEIELDMENMQNQDQEESEEPRAQVQRRNRRSRLSENQSDSVPRIAGTRFQVEKCFPAQTYKEIKTTLIRMKDRKYFVQECVICMDPITNDSKCRVLSCFHIFHIGCIDNWLVKIASCPMCNKVFHTKKDIQIDFDEQEMQQISVDNECFYSEHVIFRKADLLSSTEFKRIFHYAMPHEPRFINNKREVKSDDEHSGIVEIEGKRHRLRKRPESEDSRYEEIRNWNTKNKFGKEYWLEISISEKRKKKVGPLKIICLPSDRSIPGSPRMEFNKSLHNSETKLAFLKPPLKSAVISQLSDRLSLRSPKDSKSPYLRTPQILSGRQSQNRNHLMLLEKRSSEPLCFFNEERLGVRTPGNYRSKIKRKPKPAGYITAGPVSARKPKEIQVDQHRYESFHQLLEHIPINFQTPQQVARGPMRRLSQLEIKASCIEEEKDDSKPSQRTDSSQQPRSSSSKPTSKKVLSAHVLPDNQQQTEIELVQQSSGNESRVDPPLAIFEESSKDPAEFELSQHFDRNSISFEKQREPDEVPVSYIRKKNRMKKHPSHDSVEEHSPPNILKLINRDVMEYQNPADTTFTVPTDQSLLQKKEEASVDIKSKKQFNFKNKYLKKMGELIHGKFGVRPSQPEMNLIEDFSRRDSAVDRYKALQRNASFSSQQNKVNPYLEQSPKLDQVVEMLGERRSLEAAEKFQKQTLQMPEHGPASYIEDQEDHPIAQFYARQLHENNSTSTISQHMKSAIAINDFQNLQGMQNLPQGEDKFQTYANLPPGLNSRSRQYFKTRVDLPQNYDRNMSQSTMEPTKGKKGKKWREDEPQVLQPSRSAILGTPDIEQWN